MKQLLPALLLLTACGELPSQVVQQPLEHGESYRVTEARILDPHFYADPLFIGCTDVTNDAPAGRNSANERLAEVIEEDGDRNGLLDFTVLLQPPTEADERLAVARGRCPVDEPRSCLYDPFALPALTDATLRDDADCYTPDPERLSAVDYVPPVRNVEAPCFEAEPVDFLVDLGDSPFLLRNARFAASTASGDRLDGMLVGFLTLEEARRVDVRRTPLAEYLPGGDDVCAPHDDTDVGLDGTAGWWMHIDFVAEPIVIESPSSSAAEGGCASTRSKRPSDLLWVVLLLAAVRIRRERPRG